MASYFFFQGRPGSTGLPGIDGNDGARGQPGPLGFPGAIGVDVRETTCSYEKHGASELLTL